MQQILPVPELPDKKVAIFVFFSYYIDIVVIISGPAR